MFAPPAVGLELGVAVVDVRALGFGGVVAGFVGLVAGLVAVAAPDVTVPPPVCAEAVTWEARQITAQMMTNFSVLFGSFIFIATRILFQVNRRYYS